MSSDISTNKNINALIDNIIVKKGLKNIDDIKYQEGSQAGDGYVSKTLAVEVIHEDGVLRIFFKYAMDVKPTESLPIDQFYANEIYFYDVVYPAYREFLRDKNAEDVFHHVPKCYGTSQEGGIVALENLKYKGFTLYDRKKVMDRKHLELVLRTFAKFHAVSYAFKDQQKDKYKRLVDNCHEDLFSKVMQTPGPIKMVTTSIESFRKNLDPIEDKRILDVCGNLVEILLGSFSGIKCCSEEYSILTQGDCWCNNMMFLYEEENPSNIKDIMLIDWQLIRFAPPVFDMAYFFYTIASEEALKNLQHYLKVYHQELIKWTKNLGSDAEILYPFHVLQEQWKQHGKYGFAMATMLVRMMLCAQDEVISMEGLDFENTDDMEKMYPKIEQEGEFNRRMKILAEHFIDNDML